MFKKVLVANRGEIAIRIMSTLRGMGIKSVAVYSTADASSLHVSAADESICIGGPLSTESYCNIQAVLNAAISVGADAIHPGFGFLSENAEFARAVERANLVFIGPSAKIIESMGDKVVAKKLAIEAKVPVVPGYENEIDDPEAALKISRKIGFPVMLKAAAGGGGKGMRVVERESEMEMQYDMARKEAQQSFGDGRIFIEKLVNRPRHIEIQILCDKRGGMVCLGERECSIQRNHQKVIEEAPSSFVDEELREKMYAACRNLALTQRYYSAGTVEFLVDKDKNFYFLEMNTRIQVEHPVTELVFGIDIVEQMVLIALGRRLGFTQADLKMNGWAIESRIYAENPEQGFLPSTGVIEKFISPSVDGVRIDSGITSGSAVSPFYDPMLLKVCVHDETRERAIKKMVNVLDRFIIRGINTNVNFLLSVLTSKQFKSGDINVNFIAEHYPDGFCSEKLNMETLELFAVSSVFIHLLDVYRQFISNSFLQSVVSAPVISVEDIRRSKVPELCGEGGFHVKVNDYSLSVGVVEFNNDVLIVKVNNRIVRLNTDWWFGSDLMICSFDKGVYAVKVDVGVMCYNLEHRGMKAMCVVYSDEEHQLQQFMPEEKEDAEDHLVISPITGLVSKVFVGVDANIQKGDALCIITAMKMENVIKSPRDAKIVEVAVGEGDTVSADDTLFVIE